MHDTVKDSLLKTATWYLCDLLLTFVIAFVVTRDIGASVAIGIAQQTWELLLYFFHERVWVSIKKRKSENPGFRGQS